LADALGLPLVHLWSICPPYWQEIGFDAALPQQTAAQGGMEANRFFLTHPSNRALAKQVVYTEGKSPEETRDEILRLVM